MSLSESHTLKTDAYLRALPSDMTVMEKLQGMALAKLCPQALNPDDLLPDEKDVVLYLPMPITFQKMAEAGPETMFGACYAAAVNLKFPTQPVLLLSQKRVRDILSRALPKEKAYETFRRVLPELVATEWDKPVESIFVGDVTRN